jgi:membrane associated rhomboid family serine protease
MTPASVGFQCPECVRQSARTSPVYTTRNLPGHRPVVTYALIALNVAAFVAQLATIARGASIVSAVDGQVTEDFLLYGPAVWAGEWWRLVTSGFLHGGILHIGMNMYVLYAIGPQLERLFGPARFVCLYFAALLAGSLGVIVLEPRVGALGASGAIFGLLGAAAAFQVANRINIWNSGLGTLILINLAITFFIPGISKGAHVGGLIGGAAVGYVMFLLEQRRVPAVVGCAVGLGMAAVFAGAAIALAPPY